MKDPNYRLEGLLHEKNEVLDFEGPLSLILVLLQKNKIQIRDISISQITEQYLNQIQLMQEHDLDVASEFVRMASYLIYLKSQMMLAGDKELTELEELIQSLERLQARDASANLKEIQPRLREMYENNKASYVKGPELLPNLPEPLPVVRHGALLSALLSVFSREKAPGLSDEDFRPSVPHKILYSVRTKSLQLIELLKKGGSSLKKLYSACVSRSEIIATFISVLELCSMGTVSFKQNGDDYDLSFNGGDTDKIIEKIVE